ncbi:arf-GAP with Rho-GAP domain, ANK repeat and PH domain-containing protein 1 isoform X2 [Pimephales promelas]|uniref:arf-GAP with Rho-GAP domain, ANK repeat and PH domain-containing protein 1 isoform X2 n=1 Tax=Pimephales promelas TaxID=90988 RepID=UPI001955C61B|nr:arf-GAP with Rho-GAP domain, ANK repeat and PH domain-containing protein 1 isoform X2 [Pimephales promelas]KAG1930880.1 arf-GAP with Rho-GAP domain, ANK repeat and PH domain-containing protein [Pimephales promelas]
MNNNITKMSVSDPPVHIPVPKPRSRYLLRASVEQLFTERDGVGQMPCPDVQVDAPMNSEETCIKNDVGVDDSSNPLHPTSEPPDLQAVKTNCSETLPWPASLAISPSSDPDPAKTADSMSSDDSTVTLNSSKSQDDLNKDDVNSDNASFTDQLMDAQTELGTTEGIHQVPKSQILQIKTDKFKKPRAATIRVSRKKKTLSGPRQRTSGCAVTQSSWLDVWKGRKHNVLWTTLDGHLMSLWKKRTDKFTEYVFHVTSITNIRKQDQGHFSIYLQKKQFEFMAHSEAVQDSWLVSLHATRGREPVTTPKQHGPLIMKDPRKKVYAAICGYTLWIYSSKEDFNIGLGMMFVSMNIASVKSTGRHSFTLITPYRTFNFSADSGKEATMWLETLNDVIRGALTYSEVAHRLWASPCNKVCADCGAANPEWASVNLLVVICEACAGAHRSMSCNHSKVRGLKLDNKVWTEPLIQLFILYGNKAANSVWGHNIPPAEQIGPDVSPDQKAEFILAKYRKGLYRKAHPLAASQKLLDQRLREVVCGPDVEETLSLLCSGARVSFSATDPELQSAVSVAESSGQALQTELLRHNEFVEAPDFEQIKPSEEQMEELHGKLDEERFLFSQENESAACDVLDLTEVISVFDCSAGQTHEFEVLTLTDRLTCSADERNALLGHMLHIMKILLAGAVVDDDLVGVFAVSRACLREGAALQCAEVWCTLQAGEMTIHTKQHGSRDTVILGAQTHCHLQQSEKCILLEFAERTLHMQFELELSCVRWYELVKRAMSSTTDGPQPVVGSVPAAVDRCISHITQYGLKVEGLYRRCGIAPQISKLVDALRVSPRGTVLGTDEFSIIDVSGALKQILRQEIELIPQTQKPHWPKAAALSDEKLRLQTYRQLLTQLPPDNHATLAALCGHLHTVQTHSQANRMTAHNLAVIFVVTLFQEFAMNTGMVQLTRDLIMLHMQIFTSHVETDGETITAL